MSSGIVAIAGHLVKPPSNIQSQSLGIHRACVLLLLLLVSKICGGICCIFVYHNLNENLWCVKIANDHIWGMEFMISPIFNLCKFSNVIVLKSEKTTASK